MEINVNRGSTGPSRVNYREDMYATRPPLSGKAENRLAREPEENYRYEEPKKEKTIPLKIFDKIIGLSIFMLFFGLPLFFTGLATQGTVFEKQLYFYFWLLLGIVSWAAKGVMSGEMKIRRTPLDIPILGFLLVYTAATIFSVDRWHSFWGAFGDPSRGLMSIISYVVAYYFIFSNFNQKRLHLIFSAALSAGAVLSLWTMFAIMGVNFLPASVAQYAPVSLPGTINTLCSIIAVMIPLLIAAILKISSSETRFRGKKVIFAGLIAVLAINMFLILALSNYIPWLGLFAGIAVFLIFILSRIVRPNANWAWLPMAVFVIIMILKMTGAVSIARINLPMEVSLGYQVSADIAKESFKEKPVVGSGPATYSYDFSLNRPQNFNEENLYNLRFFQGRGMLAEAVPTIGILGSIFFIILILAFFGLEFFFLYREKEKNKLFSLGLFSAAVILVVNSLFSMADGVILAYSVIFIAAALATVMMESENQGNSINLTLKASPKFALALAFIFMVVSAGVAFLFVFLGKIYFSDIYAGRAQRLMAQDEQRAMDNFSSAIRLNKRESKYLSQISRYYMMLANTQAAASEQERDMEKIRTYLQYSISAAVAAKEMSKNDVAAVETLALIYENAAMYIPDALTLAEENYKRALELEPHNPNYFIKLGQIKLSQLSGADEASQKNLILEAKGLYEKSVDKKSNFSPGFFQMALAYEALKDLDQAIEKTTIAAKLEPKNATYLLTLGRLHQTRGKNNDAKLAESYYKAVVSLDDKNINGHFNLGMFYEKNKNKEEAKKEYKKVIEIVSGGEKNQEMVSQLEKMIANIDSGIENTPQNLGLVPESSSDQPEIETAEPKAEVVPDSTPGPTLEEVQN